PPRSFVIEKIEYLIFDQGTAQTRASLISNVLRCESRIAVAGVQAAIAEEPVTGSVNIVASALGNRVHHAAHGLTVFRGEVVGNHLELLHGLLRDRAADARSAGVLVEVGVGRVISVCQEGIVAGNAAETEQAERSIRSDRRRQQNETVDTPPVDR